MLDLLDIVVPAIFHPRSRVGQGKRCQQRFHRSSTAPSNPVPGCDRRWRAGGGVRVILGGTYFRYREAHCLRDPQRRVKERRFMRMARASALLALWILAFAPASHAQAPPSTPPPATTPTPSTTPPPSTTP